MTDKQESLLKLAELFKILGDPTRLKIVELLLENEMCVNHIAETMEMGQSANSHQLRVHFVLLRMNCVFIFYIFYLSCI